MKKKILVTGAEGFIASHLVEALLKKNFYVKATCLYNSFDNLGWLKSINNNLKKNLEIIKLDIRDPHLINRISLDCNYIFHLAALVGIPYSYVSPHSYVETNIIGTLNLLESCRQKGSKVKLFVHTSTSEIYGNSPKQPLDENVSVQAYSPYSATKIGADQLALSYQRSFDLPITVIRPFNTFGPRQSLRAIIPTIITQAIQNKVIKIGSTKPTRDFTFVDDTIEGFLSVLKTDQNKINGEIINLGTGYEISIKEVINIISKKIKKKIKIKNEKIRMRPKTSEVFRLCSDNNKSLKLLNWSPKFKGRKGLEIAIGKTIKWYLKRENIELFKHNNYIL